MTDISRVANHPSSRLASGWASGLTRTLPNGLTSDRPRGERGDIVVIADPATLKGGEDLPCPWCRAPTGVNDVRCPCCARRFG